MSEPVPSRSRAFPEATAGPAGVLARLWDEGARPDVDDFLARAEPLDAPRLAAVLRVDQRQRWLRGERVPAEVYLRKYPLLLADPDGALDLVYGEFLPRSGSLARGGAAAPTEAPVPSGPVGYPCGGAGEIDEIGELRLRCVEARGYNSPSAGRGWRDGEMAGGGERWQGEKGCDKLAQVARSAVRRRDKRDVGPRPSGIDRRKNLCRPPCEPAVRGGEHNTPRKAGP